MIKIYAIFSDKYEMRMNMSEEKRKGEARKGVFVVFVLKLERKVFNQSKNI